MKKNKPDWLNDIQNRSWEPELFISGGAIFFLLQVTEMLHHHAFLMMQQGGYYEPVVIANFIISALNALVLGFALHLILRGFWVAAVTLSYVFPKGIRTEKFNYQPKYQQRVESLRNPTDMVIRLETICSLVFALAFFAALILMGLLFTFLILIPHSALKAEMGSAAFRIVQVISFSILALGVLYAIDFLSLGYFKKHKYLASWYYPVYWFFSVLSLAPLYRSSYYTIISNIRAYIVVLGVIIYLSIAISFTFINRETSSAIFNPRAYLKIQTDLSTLDPRHYEEERASGKLVEIASIPSKVIEGNYLELFLVHQKVIEMQMQRDCGPFTQKNASLLACYANLYRVYIDDQLYPDVDWQLFTQPQSGEKGLLALIPIQTLEANKHLLKIVLNVQDSNTLEELKAFGMQGATYAVFPFWKN